MGRSLPQGFTGLGEYQVAERTPIIELNGAIPLSDLRDDQQTSGSASITDNDSEFQLTHSSAGDFVRLASTSRGRYQPGNVGQAGVGVRFGSTPPTSGDYDARWGYFEMDTSNTETVKNGLVFGRDKDGLYLEIIRDSSSEKKVRSADFSERPSPGIDLTEGHIFQVEFLYYGYELIKFSYVSSRTGSGDSRVQDLHTERLTGKTSLTNTNMQVGAVASSSSGTGSFDLFIGGRQYSVIGKYRPRTRVSAESRTGISVGTSGFTHLMSFQKKSDFREIPVDLGGFSINTNNDILFRVVQDGSLGSSTFGSLTDVPDSETAMQVDTTDTSISNGRKTVTRIIAGGETGQATRAAFGDAEVPVDLTDEGIISFEASAISSAATVDFVGKMSEAW